ncbi:MAG: DNA-directed RNA polymerase subunit K [Candidatus Woesearchaeota archaeon]
MDGASGGKLEQKPKYTKYEIARMIGSRALQIAQGAPFLIKLSQEELQRLRYNPIEIAKLEFEAGVLPITVKRPLPGKAVKPGKAAEVSGK